MRGLRSAPKLKISGDLLIKKTEGHGKIIISKKVAPKAVDRNRIKRIIKEALKTLHQKKEDFQIIVRKNIAGQKSYDLKDKMQKLLKG